jgi:hypothetical protein
MFVCFLAVEARRNVCGAAFAICFLESFSYIGCWKRQDMLLVLIYGATDVVIWFFVFLHIRRLSALNWIFNYYVYVELFFSVFFDSLLIFLVISFLFLRQFKRLQFLVSSGRRISFWSWV